MEFMRKTISHHESFDNLKRSLDDFKKIIRQPTECNPRDVHGQIKFINVYSCKSITHPKSLCIYKSLSEPTPDLQTPIKPYRHVSSQSCSISHKTFKLLPKIVVSQQENVITQKVENKKPARIGIDNLANLSQKESIIYNQVKNLSVDKQKTISHLDKHGKKEVALVKIKSKKDNLMRLSTMRRAQLTEKTVKNEKSTEKEKEKPDEIAVIKSTAKRKPLKIKQWKWVGSEGTMII